MENLKPNYGDQQDNFTAARSRKSHQSSPLLLHNENTPVHQHGKIPKSSVSACGVSRIKKALADISNIDLSSGSNCNCNSLQQELEAERRRLQRLREDSEKTRRLLDQRQEYLEEKEAQLMTQSCMLLQMQFQLAALQEDISNHQLLLEQPLRVRFKRSSSSS